MKWKVCGMTDPENIAEVLQYKPDFMGFIFYQKSPRAAQATLYKKLRQLDFEHTAKVGVFVNETLDNILKLDDHWGFDFVQLHGDETPDEVFALKSMGLRVIKALPAKILQDTEALRNYAAFADYLLFDTGGPEYGGTGKTFDWGRLEGLSLSVPFFLSGGLEAEHVPSAFNLQPQPFAMDFNSRLENVPGIKNTNSIKELANAFQA